MRATLKNFGCNLKWTADCRRPQDEKEVLVILRERAQFACAAGLKAS